MLQQMQDGSRHLADGGVGHSKNRHRGTIESCFRRDTCDPEIITQPCTARIAHFDVTHIETGVAQITGEPMTHFATGTQESD
jgi:hypothetical protein